MNKSVSFEIILSSDNKKIIDLLVETKLVSSKGEARRLIEQGGIRVNEVVISDTNEDIDIRDGLIIQRGKRQFVRIKLKS